MPPRPRTRLTTQPDPWTHHPDLLAYARRMLGDEGRNAEDVVQDAYLRLTEQGAAGRVPDDDRRWLFRVVRNLALDERRRARYATPVSDPAQGPERGSAPGDVLERRQDVRRTLEDVADLPPRERRALVLDQAGLPTVEIARRMSTSQNAVHQALFRARRRLRSARAAAWGVMPLPLVRLSLRAGETRIPEMLVAAGTPGGGRLLPVAGVAGAAVVAILGGGAAVHEIARTPEVIRAERTGVLNVASVASPAGPAQAPSARTSGTVTPPVVRAAGRPRVRVPTRVRRIPAGARREPSVNVRRAVVAAPSVRVVTRAPAVPAAPPPAAVPAAPPPAAGPGEGGRHDAHPGGGRRDRPGGHRDHEGRHADRGPHHGRGEDHRTRRDDEDSNDGAHPRNRSGEGRRENRGGGGGNDRGAGRDRGHGGNDRSGDDGNRGGNRDGGNRDGGNRDDGNRDDRNHGDGNRDDGNHGGENRWDHAED